MTQDNIQSTLHEERTFAPSHEFTNSSALSTDKLDELYTLAEEDHNLFWSQQANQEIDWHQPFNTIVDESNAPFYRWFPDGQLNISHNCLDRHLAERGDKTAIIFEGEPGDTQHISYRTLHQRVSIFANALKSQGIQKGDRVIIYMPMLAESVIAMQACARIGAIHSVVFGGFSAESLKDRIEDTGAKLVITADGQLQGSLAACPDFYRINSEDGSPVLQQRDYSALPSPIDEAGEHTELSEKAARFARQLEGRFRLQVILHDERFSSKEAKLRAKETGHNGDYSKSPVDDLAAAVILESWLRAQTNG